MFCPNPAAIPFEIAAVWRFEKPIDYPNTLTTTKTHNTDTPLRLEKLRGKLRLVNADRLPDKDVIEDLLSE